jgi:hypothetical protein
MQVASGRRREARAHGRAGHVFVGGRRRFGARVLSACKGREAFVPPEPKSRQAARVQEARTRHAGGRQLAFEDAVQSIAANYTRIVADDR